MAEHFSKRRIKGYIHEVHLHKDTEVFEFFLKVFLGLSQGFQYGGFYFSDLNHFRDIPDHHHQHNKLVGPRAVQFRARMTQVK